MDTPSIGLLAELHKKLTYHTNRLKWSSTPHSCTGHHTEIVGTVSELHLLLTPYTLFLFYFLLFNLHSCIYSHDGFV